MKIKKYALSLLTLLPIKSIAAVSQSSVLDLVGEEQNNLLLAQLKQSRTLLFQEGEVSATLDDAKARLQQLTGIADDQELEEELQKNITVLKDNGMLMQKENTIISAAPSPFTL